MKSVYRVTSHGADGKQLYNQAIYSVGPEEALRVGKMYVSDEALAGKWEVTKVVRNAKA